MINKFIIIFCFFIAGCNANEQFIEPLKPNFEEITFDVVQKQILIETNLPERVKNLLSKWFDQKIKIDGFDGNMMFIISNYSQDISPIDNGKRVDISLSFQVTLNKPSLSQQKSIEGNISSFATLTGNFTLAEFDTVIQNTQSDLILRLSKDLKSKI